LILKRLGCPSAYLRNIDSLQERISPKRLPGVVVLVARHDKVCYFKAFGKADEGVPMATDSIFGSPRPLGVSLAGYRA
jgi:hypothetical protein